MADSIVSTEPEVVNHLPDAEREHLLGQKSKDEEKRDKAIVTLSSAAIGICAAFVRVKSRKMLQLDGRSILRLEPSGRL